MKDFFGNTLEVGDTVAFNHPGYKFLTSGVVVKINVVQVRIEYIPYWMKDGVQQTNESPKNTVKKLC